MNYAAERRTLLSAVKDMVRLGLVVGSAGNASVRLPVVRGEERYLITPAGKDYAALDDAGLVCVDGDLSSIEGDGVPSSESLLHLAVYRARPDIGSVFHTHSVYASALAVARTPLAPVLDEMTVYLGGQVEVAEYGFPGSEDLASAAVQALGDRRAVLLSNHGLVCVAGTPQEALALCTLVERAAQILLLATSAGTVTLPPNDALEAERAVYLMRYAPATRSGQLVQ